MRKLAVVPFAVVTLALAACGVTPQSARQAEAQAPEAPLADSPSSVQPLDVDPSGKYGWRYNPNPSAALAPSWGPCTNTLLARRCDGAHGVTYSAPTAANNWKSVPRFSLYKPYFWNGKLVVFAKGYGEPDAPLRLPDEWTPNITALRDLYLSKGYGVAWTSCSENGYALADCSYRADELRGYFATKFNSGRAPSRTYLVGTSLGGQVVQRLAEDPVLSKKYAGALPMCGVLGGTLLEAKYVFDVRDLFDWFFPEAGLPGRADGYTYTYSTDADGSVTAHRGLAIDPDPSDGMVWDNVADADGLNGHPKAIDDAVKANPAKVSEMARVNARAADGTGRLVALRWDGTSSADPTREFSDWMRWAIFFHLKGSEDMLVRVGGTPEDNTGVTYYGTGTADKDMLLNSTFKLDGTGGIWRSLSPYAPTQYLLDNYEPTGRPLIKVLSLHNRYDPAVPFWHEDVYERKVRAAGKASDGKDYYTRLARQAGVGSQQGYGHCDFTASEFSSSFDQLVAWVERGTAPTGLLR